jgi:hypothetical protein
VWFLQGLGVHIGKSFMIGSTTWIIIGAVVGVSLAQLTELTGAFRTVGGAITGVGDVLGSIHVPLLGGPLQGASDAITGAGHEVAARGDAVRGEIVRASILLGAAIALTPTLLVLLAYAPARLARAREAAALRSLLGAGRDDPALEAMLAERALTTVSYRRLRQLAERPWADDPTTRRALAAEELRRLGVGRSRLAPDEGPADQRGARGGRARPP